MTHATRRSVSQEVEGGPGEPAPRRRSPEELGEGVARLVWESFSDLVAGALSDTPLGELGLSDEEGRLDEEPTQEALIFVLWSHTRAVGLAFHDRAEPDKIRRALDALHAAVFEDLVRMGRSRASLPLFEQWVSTRYSEYHQAAERSDVELATAAARRLRGTGEAAVAVVLEKARAVATPLRDYLEDVELV